MDIHFTPDELARILECFDQRDRRFGGVLTA